MGSISGFGTGLTLEDTDGGFSVTDLADFSGVQRGSAAVPQNIQMSANLFSTVLTIGTGAYVPPSIGDTDRNRLVKDDTDVWHSVLAEEATFEGLRRVENIITKSEDMTDAAYAGTGNAVIDSATQATYDGTNDAGIQQVNTIVDKGAGRTFTFSVNIRLVSGTIGSDFALNLRIGGNAITPPQNNIGNEVDGTSRRFTLTATTDASGTTIIPIIRWDDAGVLEITRWQLEETTGAPSTTIPNDYVSTGVVSDHGANIDAVEYFTTVNGNSVDGNDEVTEATGAAITAGTLKGLFAEGAVENIILHSRDFSNAAWTKSNITATKDAVGIDAGPIAASTLLATAANGTCFQQITVGSSAFNTSFWVKRTVGTGTIEITDDGGSNFTDITSLINSSTFTLVQINRTQANPDIGFRIVTDTDAIEVDFAGLVDKLSASSPIETAASSVTRLASTEGTFDIANFDSNVDASGSIEFDLTVHSLVARGGVAGIITPNSTTATRLLEFPTTALRIQLHDGTNTVDASAAYSALGETIECKARWSGSLMNLSAGGVTGTEGTYDGSFTPATAIVLFKDLLLGASMKNLIIYDFDQGDAWLSI